LRFGNELLLQIPQLLGEGNMVDMRIYKAADARVQPFDIVNAPLAQFVEHRQLTDDFACVHDFDM
jgi:hypothetical protein